MNPPVVAAIALTTIVPTNTSRVAAWPPPTSWNGPRPGRRPPRRPPASRRGATRSSSSRRWPAPGPCRSRGREGHLHLHGLSAVLGVLKLAEVDQSEVDDVDRD